MVRIGIVGIGFMGMIHYLAARGLAGGRVVAMCSRDEKKRAGDWTGIQGNFGPKGAQMDLSGQAMYADVAELLADPNVDLVDLCVPNDEHAELAIRALEAGKHVLVEKPIALKVAEADRMLAAAKASGKMLMVAHVLPFFPEFAFALEAVKSGRYGRLQAAHLTRVISKPDWSGGISDADRSGGPAIDLHIHDTHYIGLLCGVPKSVHARGVVDGAAVVHLTTQYLYEDSNLAVSAISGAISQKGRGFAHGFEVYLERATLSFSFAATADSPQLNSLAIILPDGSVQRPDLGSGDPVDAFTRELTVAVEAVASGSEADRLSGTLARQALAICLAEIQSVKRGGAVEIG
ncbi:MAG: putative dehydrogenase [Planctomycetota bacterium]|nr:putative dehydrogenase [Planctomycetota bacterium]